jgi:hypothetical protein
MDDSAQPQGTMMFNPPVVLSFVWCGLGYMFLGRGEPTGAILASMGALTTAWFARKSKTA